MRAVENLLNSLTDMDWGWWPFLYLRPPKQRQMTTGHVAKMSVHFGPIVALVVVLIERQRYSTGFALGVAFACVLGFFVAYRLTFAVAWNRRAARLAAEPER